MFDLVTSHDFYAMLVQDFDDFMDEQSSARRALHCAITAYHLHEWVWGDWLAKDYGTWKALAIRDRDALLAWIDHVCRRDVLGRQAGRWKRKWHPEIDSQLVPSARINNIDGRRAGVLNR